eukprot:238026-Amphidinium_carterae.3
MARVARMDIIGSVLVIGIYAHVSDPHDRALMFEAICGFLAGYNGDWILAGDYQQIICAHISLLRLVADARASEPVDFFMPPDERITCVQGRGNEIDHIVCSLSIMQRCSGSAILDLDSFPTHRAVLVDLQMLPCQATHVIATPLPLPSMSTDFSKLRMASSEYLLREWQDAFEAGQIDDMFRIWSVRWEQWLVDIALSEGLFVSAAQRGRGLGTVKEASAMRKAAWQCESLSAEAQLLKGLVAVITHIRFATRNHRDIEWSTWARCHRVWERCFCLGLLEVPFDAALLDHCRMLTIGALEKQLALVRGERAKAWKASFSHVCDPRCTKAFRFIKQADGAQFHFAQRTDGSVTADAREQDEAILAHWEPIYKPSDLPSSDCVSRHVDTYHDLCG